MKCWLCRKEARSEEQNFCFQCGMPLGETTEFASSIPGTGAATVECVNGNTYEVTFKCYQRVTMDKVA